MNKETTAPTPQSAAFPAAPTPTAPAPAPIDQKAQEDETRRRALENAEVQRFREVFGGDIRNVRNLKE